MNHRSEAQGRRLVALAAGILLAIPVHPAQAQLALSVFFGTSFSAPTPLTITQDGFPDLRLTAHYQTKPFYETWYYAGRLALWGRNHSAWIMDYTHQKVYLTNPPPEVQEFRITFGYNELTFGKAFFRRGVIWSVAAGPVVGNPYSIVRGELRDHGGGPWNSGYLLSGATVQGGLSKQFQLLNRLFLVADSRVSFSFARVPVYHGNANVPNIALHLHFGVGFGGPRRL